jgi:GxxExxY protein
MPSTILKHSQLTEQILKAFYAVYRELGFGFLEKVYENAMAIELRNLGLQVKQQVSIEVAYKDQVIGRYDADLVINDLVIVELKSAQTLTDAHQAQLLNYLKATRIEVGLLLNFGPRAEFKRKAFDNSRKGSLSWVKY